MGPKSIRTKEEVNAYKWNCIHNLSHWEGDCHIWEGYMRKGITPKISIQGKVIGLRRWIYKNKVENVIKTKYNVELSPKTGGRKIISLIKTKTETTF
ncbi:MAG: hypothetical protein EB042_04410 [Proteobacteria bacterium]|nr:hypothetical protein [Pseudomonadota bacterium]